MAPTDLRSSTRFEQESNKSNVKYVLATVPLAIVLAMFVFEAYQRPSKPFYNLPSYVTDDAMLRNAADASGSLVPLMDMTYVVLSFCVFWSILTCYFLGFLRMRQTIINAYLEKGTSILGNVVYERKGWACEFRYFGYCSYQHPDMEDATIVRKRVRVFEPYTRELVPILCIPGVQSLIQLYRIHANQGITNDGATRYLVAAIAFAAPETAACPVTERLHPKRNILVAPHAAQDSGCR